MIRIGSLEIPDIAGFDLQVNYRILSPRKILRSKNGTAILQSRWRKLAIAISGTGWLPDGLDSLDIDQLAVVHSTGWLATVSSSNVITIPRAFRTDTGYAPQGVAIVNDQLVETPLTLVGNDATLTAVTGATQYQVVYCPVLNALINDIGRDFDEQNNVWSWTLEAEEQ